MVVGTNWVYNHLSGDAHSCVVWSTCGFTAEQRVIYGEEEQRQVYAPHAELRGWLDESGSRYIWMRVCHECMM